jgi:hypothetical protein
MSALFGSLFFLLLPFYDIVIQQNTMVHPILRIISILILLISLISGAFASKKIAYLSHDIGIAQKQNESFLLPTRLQKVLNGPTIATLLFFTMFLLMKTLFLKSLTFFLQSFFGSIISILLSLTFFMIYLWSTFVLIQNHINEKNPDTYVSFWGKQFFSHEILK